MLKAVWPNGYIIFQILAVYNIENFMSNTKWTQHCKKLKNCCHGGNNFAKSGHSGWYPCSGDYLLRYFHWLLPSILSLHWLKLDSNPRPRDWFAKPENTNLFAKEDYHVLLDLTKQVNMFFIQHKQSSWINTSKTGGQTYSDTSPYTVSEKALAKRLAH